MQNYRSGKTLFPCPNQLHDSASCGKSMKRNLNLQTCNLFANRAYKKEESLLALPSILDCNLYT